MTNVLGIIPARGGSKGVPRKNIRLVAGRPLIEYTIQAAKSSRYLTDFLTSTDDEEIAAIAMQLGSPVIWRPPELAADNSPTVPVVLHALESSNKSYQYVVVLQPTSPQRTGEDIDAAVKLLLDTGADSVISVCPVGHNHPSRMYKLIEEKLTPYDPVLRETPRQLVPPLYQVNGAVFACRRTLVEERQTLIGPDIRPYFMPRERSVNIDDLLDLAFVDFLISHSDWQVPI